MSVPVFANSYSDNYKSFVQMNKNGQLFSPNTYSKTKTVNELFIEEFYEYVFFKINYEVCQTYLKI